MNKSRDLIRSKGKEMEMTEKLCFKNKDGTERTEIRIKTKKFQLFFLKILTGLK